MEERSCLYARTIWFSSISREDQRDLLLLEKVHTKPISDAAPETKWEYLHLAKQAVKIKNTRTYRKQTSQCFDKMTLFKRLI